MRRKYLIMLFLITCMTLITACARDNITEVIVKEIEYVEALDFKGHKQNLMEYKKYLRKKRYENSRIVLTAVGDIMVGRRVGKLLEEKGTELAYKNLEAVFSKADILFGNLECPISNGGKKLPGKGICLRAKPEMIEVLKKPGFDIVSLANNHILDYDTEALFDTFEILSSNGIGYVGAGKNIEEARKPYIIENKGKTFAVLAYDKFAYIYYSNSYKRRFAATENLSGTAPFRTDFIMEDVKKVREKVDFVIVSLHWGVEESNNITSTQREIAHELIDNGVDIILGHHPHVIQPIEIYKEKPIIYSMGNYIFDQNDENNKQGMVVSIIIEYGEIKELNAIPTYILNKSEPIIAEDEKGVYIKNKIVSLSKRLDTKGEVQGNRVIFKIK